MSHFHAYIANFFPVGNIIRFGAETQTDLLKCVVIFLPLGSFVLFIFMFNQILFSVRFTYNECV